MNLFATTAGKPKESLSPQMLLNMGRVWLMVPRVRGAIFALSLLGAIALTGYQGVMFSYNTFMPQHTSVPTSLIMPTENEVAENTPILVEDYIALRDATWFGTSYTAEKEQLVEEKVVVETTLNLQLKGTIVGPNSRAIIKDNATGKTLILKEGENFLNGVKVARVTRRRVLLDNKGQMEGLSLAGEDYMAIGGEPTIMPAMGKVAPSQVVQKSAGIKRLNAQQQDTYIPMVNRKITKRQKLKLEKSEVLSALSNLATLGKQARFIPRIKDGRVEGFIVTQLEHDSFLARMSLKEGDILVKLDDVPVGQKDKLFPMMMGLATASEAELVINRGGEQIALMVDFSS
jgi:type II secretion system protein C